MEKQEIKKEIYIYVPIEACTLRCHYCYITHHRKFNTKIPEFAHTPEFIKKAFSKERLGGTCLINICAGGETLLAPIIVDYIKVLLENGHIVMVVTNGTISARFDELAKFPRELTSKLFFKFSYHYLQHKEKNLTEVFFNNIKKVREAGCSFTLEITPSDELIPYIDDIKKEALKYVGAIPHCTIARDEHVPNELPILTGLTNEEYFKTWSSFNSDLFNYKWSIWGHKVKEFCYAGKWSCYVDLLTGDWRQCHSVYFRDNIYKDLSKPFPEIPIGNKCYKQHCYNGHSFIVFGCVPELKTCLTYADIRNRICLDGSEWLQGDVKVAFESKHYENNKELNSLEKRLANKKIEKYIRQSMKNRLKNKIRQFFNK